MLVSTREVISMNISELKTHFKTQLSGVYPSEEIQSFFNILSESLLNISAVESVLNPEKTIAEAAVIAFQDAVNRLLSNEPIQYILGETAFYGLPFKVNKHTLIPRPETEELVSWILSEINNSNLPIDSARILDIGTGSGCIAVSLAKNIATSEVYGMDISEEALTIARENAILNSVKVTFLQADVLGLRGLEGQYDVIVSNPPYVRELEKQLMHENVLKHEPNQALYVSDDDPLVFYRKIAQLAKKHLKPNGKLFFEINEYLGKEMISLLKSEGFNTVELKKDIYGKDRMLKCSLDE